jgi:protein-S-isoprenylcysteine O-methyltransferase Ste14
LITLLGVGLALTNWASLISLLTITIIGYMYRINIEEQALVETLGDAYREYMHHTHRLIPYIW